MITQQNNHRQARRGVTRNINHTTQNNESVNLNNRAHRNSQNAVRYIDVNDGTDTIVLNIQRGQNNQVRNNSTRSLVNHTTQNNNVAVR
jgi:hypothetical protein